MTYGRCIYSGNPCGTDTWQVGTSCPCSECQRWLQLQPAALRAPAGGEVEEARRALRCLYIAVQSDIADTVSEKIEAAFAALLAQRAAEVEGLRKELAVQAKQAKLFEEEIADGDLICAALGVERTEGGRLPHSKMIALIKDLHADKFVRLPQAEAALTKRAAEVAELKDALDCATHGQYSDLMLKLAGE